MILSAVSIDADIGARTALVRASHEARAASTTSPAGRSSTLAAAATRARFLASAMASALAAASSSASSLSFASVALIVLSSNSHSAIPPRSPGRGEAAKPRLHREVACRQAIDILQAERLDAPVRGGHDAGERHA